jgi:hypothetical protein
MEDNKGVQKEGNSLTVHFLYMNQTLTLDFSNRQSHHKQYLPTSGCQDIGIRNLRKLSLIFVL